MSLYKVLHKVGYLGFSLGRAVGFEDSTEEMKEMRVNAEAWPSGAPDSYLGRGGRGGAWKQEPS